MSIFKKTDSEQAANPAAETKNTEPAMMAAKSAKKGKNGRGIDKRNKSLKTISVTSTVLFLVIVLVFNIVFDKLLGNILKWDWSSGEQYTLGDVSKEILGAMTQDVEIIGLFDKAADQYYSTIMPMLDEYAAKSNGRVTLRYVDPVKFPSILTEVDPAGYLAPKEETFVVYCKATGKAKNVTYNDVFDVQYDSTTYESYLNGVTAEQSISGAIKYVQSETTPVVYFTSGHNELDYTSSYSLLVTILKNNNYDVKSLELFNLDKIPEDCSTMIMVSPEKDISTSERNLLSAYLQKGGSLMVISDYDKNEFPELNILLSDYNLEISNNKIREGDQDHRYNSDAYTIRAIAPESSLTTSEVDGFTLVDNVRGMIALKNTKEWITVEPILTTTESGVAETKGDAAKSSAAGTQNIGLISENTGYVDGTNVTQSARVMLVGSSSIFTDTVLKSSSQLYNVYLFYYGVQWLANSDASDSLYIEAKVPASYTISTGNTTTYVFTAVVVMVLIPGALLLAALFVYRKRKHL